MNVEFYVHSILIARRQPAETDVPILLTWIVNEQDAWLHWLYPEPVSPYWFKPSYDDGGWKEIESGSMQSDERGEVYLRKHFALPDHASSRLGVRIHTSSSIVVYLNGALVWKWGVSESCDDGACDFTPIARWIHPHTDSFVAPLSSASPDEGTAIFAVRLLGRQSVLQQISFQLIAFPIYSSVLLSSPSCAPIRSPPVSPVSPFPSFVG